jgi:hypothetical protein
MLHTRQVCAYCGVAKVRLFPHHDTKTVATKVAAQQEEHERFFGYRAHLIEQYRSGHKAARNPFEGLTETVAKKTEFNITKRDRGIMMLLPAYIAEHGDFGNRFFCWR